MKHPQLEIATVVSLPFEENTYVANLTGSSDCVVVDPGFEPEKIQQYLTQRQLQPAALLITHGHSDHIAGVGYMKQQWPDCPIVVGENEAAKLTDPALNLSGAFGLSITSPAADQLVAEGDVYHAAGMQLYVLEVPGHSSGHIVFLWKDSPPHVLIGGDVLFAGSIGRTDFPDGSFEQLAAGIHKKIFTLPDDTIVLPGHGPTTTVGDEKRSNPFVGGPAGYRPESTSD